MRAYLLVAFCVLTLAAGQVMFKGVSRRIASITDIIADPVALGMLAIALSAYGVSTLAWVVALQRLPLSTAYMFMSLGFIIVPMSAYFFYGEPLSFRLMIGASLVVAGVIIAAT